MTIRDVLRAREHRASLLRELSYQAFGPLVFVTVSVPGLDKNRPGVADLFARSMGPIHRAFPGSIIVWEGTDELGPYRAFYLRGKPERTKKAAVRLEDELPWGRLLEIDVYGSDGRPMDRTQIGLEHRRCLICSEPEHECVLLGRHTDAQLLEAVDALIGLARAG